MIRTRSPLFLLFLGLSACAHRAGEHGLLESFEPLPDPALARRLVATEPDPGRASELAWLAANDAPLALEVLDRALDTPRPDPGLLLRRAFISLLQLSTRSAHADLLRVLEVDREGASAELALAALLDTMPTPPAVEADAIVRVLDRAPSLVERPSPVRLFLAARLRAQLLRYLTRATGEALATEERGLFEAAGAVPRLRARGPLAPPALVSLERPSVWELGPAELPRGAHGRDLRIRGGQFELGRGQNDGLYVADVYVRVGGTETIDAQLLIHTLLPVRVRLDGAVVLERLEIERDLPALWVRRVRLEPGWHHLRLAALRRAQSGVALHLVSDSGAPVAAETSAELPLGVPMTGSTPLERSDPSAEAAARVARALGAPPSSPWVRAWLGQESLGLARRDLELARRALIPAVRGADRSAIFTLLDARLVQQEGQPRALIDARLRRALELAPEVPSLLYGVAGVTSHEDPERALALVDRLRRAAPDSSAADELAFRIHERRGWNHEAEVALLAAETKNPPPAFLEAAARFFRGQFRLAEAERREDAARAARGLRARRDRVKEALESGDVDQAVARLEASAARASDPTAPWVRVAELELLRGDHDRARRAAERLEVLAPWSSAGPELAATALAAAGSATQAVSRLEHLRAAGFEDVDLEVLCARLEGRSPGEPPTASPLGRRLAYDAPAVARAPVSREFEGFREVRLLDRVVDHVRPTGHVLSLRHALSRLDTKEAADRAGEFRLPERALGLELRTLKSDGRVIEVDEHEGKADLSFSALAPGDSVERKWVMTEDPATALGGYTRFFFFRDDVPTLQTELFVVVPRGTPVRWQSYHGAPAPEVFQSGAEDVYLFSRRNVPGMRLEPASAPYIDYVPFVAVTVGLDEDSVRYAHRARLIGLGRSSYQVRERAQALIAGAQDPARQVELMFRFVATEIRPGPALAASTTLGLGRGNRTVLLHALLREVGIDAELILARGGDEGWPEPPFLDPARFGYLMLRIALPDRPRPLFADLGGTRSGGPMSAWLGLAPARFRGGRYLPTRDPDAAPVTFQDDEVERNESATQVELAVSATGDAEGTITFRFDGGPTATMKDALRRLQEREFRQMLQGLVANTVPGARVSGFEALQLDEPLAPLELKVGVTVHQLLSPENGAWVSNQFFSRLTSGVFVGLSPLEQLIQVPRRESPMRLQGAAERLSVTLRLPTGTPEPTERPESFSREEQWGRVAQTSRFESSTLRFEREVEFQAGQVAPADYPRFYAFVQDLALRMRNRLRFERRPETAARP